MTIGFAYSGTMMGMFGFAARFRLGSACALALLWAAGLSQSGKLPPSVLHQNWNDKEDEPFKAERDRIVSFFKKSSSEEMCKLALDSYKKWQSGKSNISLFRASLTSRLCYQPVAEKLKIGLDAMQLKIYRELFHRQAPSSYLYCREAYLLGTAVSLELCEPQSATYYRTLLKRNPQDLAVVRAGAQNLIGSLKEEYMYDEAVSLIDRLVKANAAIKSDYSFLSSVLYFRGKRYKSLTDLEASLVALDKAATMQPSDNRPLNLWRAYLVKEIEKAKQNKEFKAK